MRPSTQGGTYNLHHSHSFMTISRALLSDGRHKSVSLLQTAYTLGLLAAVSTHLEVGVLAGSTELFHSPEDPSCWCLVSYDHITWCSSNLALAPALRG